MEKDDELKGIGNSYDFGARMFDPRVGRWFAPDPMEKEFCYISPYAYALNNPIFNIDSDGQKPDPIFVKFMQLAFNNIPKIKAYEAYNLYASETYGNDNHRLSTSLTYAKLPFDKKYLAPKTTMTDKNILGDNRVGDEVKLNFGGEELNISYSYTKKSNISLYTVTGIEFKLGKNGKPHLYGGTGVANGMGGGSGYFMELDHSDSDYAVPVAIIQFKSLNDAKKAQKQYNSIFTNTLNDLLKKDPLVKMYRDLDIERKEVLLPLYNEYEKDPTNKQKKEKYEKAEKKYLKNRDNYIKFKEKVVKYEKTKG